MFSSSLIRKRGAILIYVEGNTIIMEQRELIEIACKARENAYAPYSQFRVGAALLSTGGKIFTGANVENASYGLSTCAERIAVFKAVSEGELEFDIIAVVGSGVGYTYPCGACLQVLAEFSPELRVIVADEKSNYKEYGLDELLPLGFRMLDVKRET
jgi:cytidine deaminase